MSFRRPHGRPKPLYFVGPRMPGLLKPGNIDLIARAGFHVPAPEGGFASVRSISIGADGHVVLIPTVVGGKVVSDDVAVQHFRNTGEHLGFFRNERAAEIYAERLHRQQARMGARMVPPLFP